MPQPTVGRIVHYRDWGPTACLAAMVVGPTRLDGRITLTVFTENSTTFRAEAVEGTGSSQWHWPEREPDNLES